MKSPESKAKWFSTKLAYIGVVAASLIAPISASAGHAQHSCSPVAAQRSGGISEMASCGTQGVRDDRAQFVRAITWYAAVPDAKQPPGATPAGIERV